ncbi:hypothetical protein N7537_009281 [Penicillium hordei]|uniref:Uncharacterized protein n=1 Tax=Penicillium hordei TaxID=40994 RepID=A0AAD6DTZ9_9EURO|nr:uncharacterized protein N7537_009281 [Penicillium hordei]KAJ5592377.1 hypothetical protein N7537_009281 [Penicillium hordei]
MYRNDGVAPPSHWMNAVISISALSPETGATSIAPGPIQAYQDLIKIFRTKLPVVEERQGDLYIRGGIEQINTLAREDLALLSKVLTYEPCLPNDEANNIGDDISHFAHV